MLFLVISEPRPERPSTVTVQRRRYWDWVAPLQAAGTVRAVHAKVGRGAVVLFDVPDHEALHRHLTAWAEIVPARFDIHPLIEAAHAQSFLQSDPGAGP